MLETSILPGTYKMSSGFSLVPRDIVSGVYPPNSLTYAEMCRVLHVYVTRNNRFGTTIAGRQDYTKHFGHISMAEFRRIEKYLIHNGFYKIKSVNKKVTVLQVLSPPTFNTITGKIEQMRPDEIMNAYNVEQHVGFIRLPQDLFRNGFLSRRSPRRLSCDELMVLLKLYMYNSLESYGGVDFRKVHMNGSVYVSDTISDDIYLSKDSVVSCIGSLEAKGLVSWVDVDLETIVVDRSIILDCFATDAALRLGTPGKPLRILRPYLQPPLMAEDRRVRK